MQTGSLRIIEEISEIRSVLGIDGFDKEIQEVLIEETNNDFMSKVVAIIQKIADLENSNPDYSSGCLKKCAGSEVLYDNFAPFINALKPRKQADQLKDKSPSVFQEIFVKIENNQNEEVGLGLDSSTLKYSREYSKTLKDNFGKENKLMDDNSQYNILNNKRRNEALFKQQQKKKIDNNSEDLNCKQVKTELNPSNNKDFNKKNGQTNKRVNNNVVGLGSSHANNQNQDSNKSKKKEHKNKSNVDEQPSSHSGNSAHKDSTFSKDSEEDKDRTPGHNKQEKVQSNHVNGTGHKNAYYKDGHRGGYNKEGYSDFNDNSYNVNKKGRVSKDNNGYANYDGEYYDQRGDNYYGYQNSDDNYQNNGYYPTHSTNSYRGGNRKGKNRY